MKPRTRSMWKQGTLGAKLKRNTGIQLYANASPALSTPNSSVSQYLTSRLTFTLPTVYPSCSRTPLCGIKASETIILFYRLTLKIRQILRLLSIQGAFWPCKPIILFSKTFVAFHFKCGFLWMSLLSIYFTSASFSTYPSEALSQCSHSPSSHSTPQAHLPCLCPSHCITSDNHSPYISA